MKEGILLYVGATAIIFSIFGFFGNYQVTQMRNATVTQMVLDHARAWETGDEKLLSSLLHEDVVFAYPGRRLTKEQTLEDLRFFRDAYADTKVYVQKIVVDGNDVAVEWQFATTKKETGKREVVSDAIIGKVRDGKFVVWKEYLDGRVKGLQAEGTLELEEGEEPFPSPRKAEAKSSREAQDQAVSTRAACEAACRNQYGGSGSAGFDACIRACGAGGALREECPSERPACPAGEGVVCRRGVWYCRDTSSRVFPETNNLNFPTDAQMREGACGEPALACESPNIPECRNGKWTCISPATGVR